MKTCNKCKEEKELDKFGKDKTKKDGLKSTCKECRKIEAKKYNSTHKDELAKYRRENKEKIKIGRKIHYDNNKDKILAKNNIYQKENKESINIYNNKYRSENPHIRKKGDERYRKNNPEKEKARHKKYATDNPEKVKESSKRNRLKNKDINKIKAKERNQAFPEKTNAQTAKRRAAKESRTPKWLTKYDYQCIKDIYKKASFLAKNDKIKYHVDHIIPLHNKNISGLHVPWNLQILTSSENQSKRNKFDGTYENESWRKDL